MKYDYRIMTVMSDRHQQEHRDLLLTMYRSKYTEELLYLIPSLVSRMSCLEYQAKLKVDSILELCRTGR